VAGLKL